MKLKILLNKKRPHFFNRLRQRNGSILWFLFAKVIGTKPSYTENKCLVWRFKNHYYLTQNNILQTYIYKAKEYKHLC